MTIPATGHKLNKIEAKNATETAEGNIEYWSCDDCEKIFKDAEAEDEILREDTIIAKLEKKSDTTGVAKASGNTVKAEKQSNTIKAEEHKPIKADEQKPVSVTLTSPQTGDETHMGLYLVVLFVALGGICIFASVVSV